jgi:PAS domain S-box-containing protein
MINDDASFPTALAAPGSAGFYLERLLALNAALAQAQGQQAIMVAALAQVAEAVALDASAIWRNQGERAQILARWGNLGPVIPPTMRELAVPQVYFENLRQSGMIVADRVTEDNFWYFVGAKSTLSVVLSDTTTGTSSNNSSNNSSSESSNNSSSETTIGLLGLSLVRFSEVAWLPEQQQFLRLAAQALVAALERAQNDSLWRGVFSQSADYKVLLDANLHIVDVNQATLQLVGLEQAVVDTFRGLPYQDTPLIKPLMGQEQPLLWHLQQAQRGEKSKFEMEIERHGEKLLLDCVALPLYDSSGQIAHILTQGHDISVERRHQNMLSQVNQARSAFFARLSHELRTPLSVVLGHTQLLALDSNDSSFQSILDAGQHMVYLLDELLDLARMDADHLQINHETLNVADAINEVLVMFLPMATQRQLRLQGHLPADGLPRLIEADGQRLRQVLMNLLSNALKFNRAGGSITVSLFDVLLPDQTANQTAKIRIEVRDTGLGMTSEQLLRLFVPFERLGVVDIEGTGLGLALSKRLVELMNGSIGVSSRVGEGSVFWLDFPFINAISLFQKLPLLNGSGVYGDVKPILYVEDDASNRQLLQYLASQRPYISLECAENVSNAIDLLETKQFAVIVLDLHLPDGSGLQVVRYLRQKNTDFSVPIIITSADAFAQNDPELRSCLNASRTRV